MAYGQKVGAESAVDINLAKQLNVLMTQLGVAPTSIVMNVGSAAAGYGYEYVASTLDRIRAAALAQSDTPAPDAHHDARLPRDLGRQGIQVMSEADMPEWGSAEERGIEMEITTAAACLAGGSDAVIMRHPAAIKTISEDDRRAGLSGRRNILWQLKVLTFSSYLPKKNCKECGSPTCMAFCMKVAQGAVPIDEVPVLCPKRRWPCCPRPPRLP